MAHASMHAVGCDARDLVAALLDVLGPEGTLAAYVDWEMESDDAPFDAATARAARSNGVLAETIRAWPGALRSAHPDAGVAAIGAKAAWLVADHPLHYGYGPGSPFDKLVRGGGKVLLLGAPLDTITLLHHSEHVAAIPDKRIAHYERNMPSGRVSFEEFDTADPVHASFADDYFAAIARDHLAAGGGATATVGGATAYLFDAAPLHAFAVAWIERRVRR